MPGLLEVLSKDRGRGGEGISLQILLKGGGVAHKLAGVGPDKIVRPTESGGAKKTKIN